MKKRMSLNEPGLSSLVGRPRSLRQLADDKSVASSQLTHNCKLVVKTCYQFLLQVFAINVKLKKP